MCTAVFSLACVLTLELCDEKKMLAGALAYHLPGPLFNPAPLKGKEVMRTDFFLNLDHFIII